MKQVLAVVPLVFLTACATDQATMKTMIEFQSKQKPTLAVTCPAGGCSIEYTDPRDRSIRMPTNGWDAMISMGNNVTGLVGGAVAPAIVGAVAVQGYKYIEKAGQGGNVQNVTTTTTTSNTVITASGNGASTGGTGHYEQIGPDSNNTQTTSSVTEDNSSITTTTTDNHAVDNHSVTDVVPTTTPVPAI